MLSVLLYISVRSFCLIYSSSLPMKMDPKLLLVQSMFLDSMVFHPMNQKYHKILNTYQQVLEACGMIELNIELTCVILKHALRSTFFL